MMIGGQNIINNEETSPVASKQISYTCLGCRVKFDSIESQRAHYKTEWHLYNLKRRVCDLPPIDLDSFNIIHAAAPAKKPSDEDSKRISNKRGQQQQQQQQQPGSSMDTNDNADDDNNNDDGDDDEEWEDEEVEDEELLDEDYDEEEAAEMLARVIKPTTCLFCDKKSHNLEKSVDHMNSLHGFFIPEDQYLIDLAGMIEYLGFKVGAGSTCLWCNKQFKSLHAVRLHMLYKDHCKIFYDQERALDEFKDFYDYSKQEQIAMKPLNQLAIPKRRSESRSEYDRSLVATKSASDHGGKQLLVAKKNLAMVAGSYQAKNIKKFDAYRAKIVLRTGMANNYTMRGRLRQQNPI